MRKRESYRICYIILHYIRQASSSHNQSSLVLVSDCDCDLSDQKLESKEGDGDNVYITFVESVQRQINWKYCLCFSAPLIYLYNQQKHFQNMLFLYSYTFFSFSWKKNFSLINSICHQNLRFVIYDIDDDSGDLSSQDPLGTAECRLGQVGVVFHLASSSPSPSSSNSSAV